MNYPPPPLSSVGPPADATSRDWSQELFDTSRSINSDFSVGSSISQRRPRDKLKLPLKKIDPSYRRRPLPSEKMMPRPPMPKGPAMPTQRTSASASSFRSASTMTRAAQSILSNTILKELRDRKKKLLRELQDLEALEEEALAIISGKSSHRSLASVASSVNL